MNQLYITAVSIVLIVNLAYLVSRILKRNDIMDVLWGLGFVLIAWVQAFFVIELSTYQKVFVALVTIWGLRLSLHILIKNWGKPEDFRYAQWRKDWGKTEIWRSYLQVYILQGFFMFWIAFPITFFMGKVPIEFTNSSMLLFYIGFVIAFSGLSFESIADFQKSVFKKKNSQGLMDKGLWAYSRHPNYFGEAVFWWGIAVASASQIHWIWGLLSAGAIHYLLRYVSGVPMLEKSKKGSAEYEAYKKRTPVFVPFVKPN